MNQAALKKIIEGKTKIIYEHPENPKWVYMVFKDDITAGDGIKHDQIEGKAAIDWRTNKNIYDYLNKNGITTHYISSPEEKVSVVKKMDRKINLEVVSRRVAAGSILKWSNITEGTRFDPVITQFHYKDDPLHDPMLDESYIQFMIEHKNSREYQDMKDMNATVFNVLERAFSKFNLQLIDMKLEYGLIDNKLILLDEITGGSFRLWPYRHQNPNLVQANVLSELDPDARLDKDNYRMGKDLGVVKSKFVQIAEITNQF